MNEFSKSNQKKLDDLGSSVLRRVNDPYTSIKEVDTLYGMFCFLTTAAGLGLSSPKLDEAFNALEKRVIDHLRSGVNL